MKKFGASLSERQIQLARSFERAGLTTYSQAVKAIERGNSDQIEIWKSALKKGEEETK